MIRDVKHSATPGRIFESSGKLWRGLRLAALLGNAVYLVGFISGLVVLVGLGSAPMRAYANVLFALIIALATALLNLKAIRGKGFNRVISGLAVVLNLTCFGYLVTRPEYALAALGLLVALAPLLNIAVIATRWSRLQDGVKYIPAKQDT